MSDENIVIGRWQRNREYENSEKSVHRDQLFHFQRLVRYSKARLVDVRLLPMDFLGAFVFPHSHKT